MRNVWEEPIEITVKFDPTGSSRLAYSYEATYSFNGLTLRTYASTPERALAFAKSDIDNRVEEIRLANQEPQTCMYIPSQRDITIVQTPIKTIAHIPSRLYNWFYKNYDLVFAVTMFVVGTLGLAAMIWWTRK